MCTNNTNRPDFIENNRSNTCELNYILMGAQANNICCVKHYYKTGSFEKAQDAFVHQCECEKAHSKSRFQEWVDHFESYETVENVNATSDNRPNQSRRTR